MTNGWVFALYQGIKNWNRERIRRRRLWKLVHELVDKLDDQTQKLQELGLKVERGFAHQDGRMDGMHADFTAQFQHQREVIQLSQEALTTELSKAKLDINQNTADVFATYLKRLEETDQLLNDMRVKLDLSTEANERNFNASHSSIEDLAKKLDYIIQFIEPLRSQTASLPPQQQQNGLYNSSSSGSNNSNTSWQLATAN